jgi:hypothetical protein
MAAAAETAIRWSDERVRRDMDSPRLDPESSIDADEPHVRGGFRRVGAEVPSPSRTNHAPCFPRKAAPSDTRGHTVTLAQTAYACLDRPSPRRPPHAARRESGRHPSPGAHNPRPTETEPAPTATPRGTARIGAASVTRGAQPTPHGNGTCPNHNSPHHSANRGPIRHPGRTTHAPRKRNLPQPQLPAPQRESGPHPSPGAHNPRPTRTTRAPRRTGNAPHRRNTAETAASAP